MNLFGEVVPPTAREIREAELAHADELEAERRQAVDQCRGIDRPLATYTTTVRAERVAPVLLARDRARATRAQCTIPGLDEPLFCTATSAAPKKSVEPISISPSPNGTGCARQSGQ